MVSTMTKPKREPSREWRLTVAGESKYNLSMHDIGEIGKAVGPGIREGMRAELNAQTRDISKNIGDLIDKHEVNDNHRFDNLDKRMSKVEYKVAWAAGAVFVLIVVWEIIKHKIGM